MRKLLPRRREFTVLLVMAAICTLVVALSTQRDVALAVMGMPVFLVSCLMGLRRSEEHRRTSGQVHRAEHEFLR